MEKTETSQTKKPGEVGYLNKNCWLVRSLGYSPYRRCQYCQLKFRHCLFLHYQIISLVLVFFIFVTAFILERKISELIIISVFVFIIVYGYFFNKNTDKLIRANFNERKVKESLEDLTENLEQKVREQTRNIEVLLEMKSEFLRIVSHQLRTPVSIIMGYLSMIQEGTIKGEKRIKEIINKVFLSAQRLVTILDDILIAQELVGQKPILSLRPCQIEKIIAKVINHFQFVAKQKKISLEFVKPKQSLPPILLDEERLGKAISKIIDNAVLYTEKGGVVVKIDLIKDYRGDVLEIKIKDTGIGINKEDKDKIFLMFSRGKRATNINPNGSGLGLYIAKAYIEAHQGKIEVQSEGENKGTTFVITLPIPK